jgi:hypothetical protein
MNSKSELLIIISTPLLFSLIMGICCLTLWHETSEGVFCLAISFVLIIVFILNLLDTKDKESKK